MATYKGLTVEIGATTKGLQSALREASKGARETQNELKQVQNALKFNPSSTRLLTRQMELLQEKVEQTKKRLDVLKQAEQQIGKENMSSEQWTKLQAEIATTESKLSNFTSQLGKAQSALKAQNTTLGQLGSKLTEFGNKYEQAGRKVSAIGQTLTGTLTPAVIGAGAATVAAATTIDTSLTNVRKTVDGTEQQYQALKDAAIEFSKTNAVSASQILDIQALGAQLGFSIDELDQFSQVVSGLDIATNMDAETAATELAQFANITKMSHDEVENYGAAIVGLGNNFATTESDISAMAMRIAAAGTQVGMSQADILGLSTALASLGVEAEAGGTAVSNTLSTIDKAVATNSDELQTWAAAAGMSADEFASAWKDAPVETFSTLLSNLEAVTAEGGNMSVMLEELGIDALRQTDVMKRMAGNSELVAEAVNKANSEWEANTALTREVENRNQSLASRFEMIKNRVIAVADDIGGPLAEALLAAIDAAQPLFDAIESGAQAFADMDTQSQQLVISLAGIAAASGPILNVFGKIPTIAKTLGGVFTTIAGSGGAAATVLTTLTSLLNPATVAIGALVAIVGGGLLSAYSDWASHQETLNTAMKSAGDIMTGAKGGVEEYASSLEQLSADSDEVIQNLANLSKQVEDSLGEQYGQEFQLDNYIDTIKSLQEIGKESELTAYQQDQLAAAVDGYNSITGDSIEITNAARGEISKSTEDLMANADAWRENARAQAYQEAAQGYYEQEAEAVLKLTEAQEVLRQKQEALADARQAYNDALNDPNAGALEVETLRQKMEEAQWAVDDARTSVNELSQSVKTAGDNADAFALQAAIMGSNLDTSLKQALTGLPVTMQEAGYNAMSALNTAIQNGTVTTDQALQFLNSGIKNSLSTLPVEMQAQGGQIVQSLATAISTGMITVGEATNLLTAGVSGVVAQLPYNLQQQGLFAVNALAGAISNGQISVGQAVQIINAAAKGNLSTLPPELQSVGGQAVSLLASSLSSGTGQVSGASNQLKDAASVEGIGANAGAEAQAVPDQTAAAIAGGTGEVSAAADGYGPAVADAVTGAAEQAGAAANTIPETLSSALQAGSGAVTGAAETLVTSATDALNQAPEQASTAGTDTGNSFAEGVNAGTGPTSAAGSAVASSTESMTNNMAAAFSWGSSQGSNYASGLRSQVGAVAAAAAELAAAAAAPLHHSTPDEGPLKDDDIWGVHMAQNFADGITEGLPYVEKAATDAAQTVADYIEHPAGGKPKLGPLKEGEKLYGLHAMRNFRDGIDNGRPLVEQSSEKIAQAVADYIAHSQPKKGPLSQGEWIFGYHAAVNFADGLASGAGVVEDAAASLGDAAVDGLEDADAQMQAYIDGMIAGWEDRSDQFADKSTAFGDALWGGIYQGIMSSPWRKPATGAVYDSMKILEQAGFDSLEDYEQKIADYQEELAKYQEQQSDYDKKRGSGKWSDSDQENYTKWLKEYNDWQAEYNNFLDMQGSLTASGADLKAWQSLYKLKNNAISGIDDAQEWSDALNKLFAKTGVVYTEEFVNAITEGGDEYLDAVKQMGDMTDEEVQGMVDAYTDLGLAQKQQELDQRSLYVNSLKYVNFKTPKERMIEFRETCLDVKEAVYSDTGLSNAFEHAGATIEGFAADLHSMDVTMGDFVTNWQDYTGQVANGFQQFTKYGQTSLEDWEETLKLNMAESQAWADNLEAVFAKVPESIDSEAFRKAVYEGGFSQWGQVIADMAGQSSEQIAGYINLYNQAMQQAQVDGINAFKALAPGEEMVNTLIEGLVNNQGSIFATMTDLSTGSVEQLKTCEPQWYGQGQSLAGQIASGIQSQINAIASAAAATVSAALAAARSAASSGVSSVTSSGSFAVISERPAVRSAMSAASQMPRMAAMGAGNLAATQAAPVSNNTSNVTMSFTVNTQPGQTVDVRQLAKEINTLQNREMRARGMK